MTPAALTAAQAGLVSCETCQPAVAAGEPAEPGYCPRCGERARPRATTTPSSTRGRSSSPPRSATSRPTCLPVLTTTALGPGRARHDHERRLLLYTTGSWPLALIVLVASVMIPLGKLIALAYLLITVQRGSIASNRERTRLYRMVEFIGRWSMLDVFVATFTVALVQLQPLMSVEPGAGRAVLRGGRRADDARGRVLRPSPHLGCRAASTKGHHG